MHYSTRMASDIRRAAAILPLVGVMAIALLGCGSSGSSTSSEPEQSSIAPTRNGSSSQAMIEEAKAQANTSIEEAKEKSSQTVEDAKANASLSKGELQTIKAEAKENLLMAKEQAKEALEAAEVRAGE